MRLHRLEVTAFGPFAGTVEVDFDAVGVNGLFLVHGPTGAGKTSLLDAVCFALYAGVPGARPGGKALRSDHAGRDAVPVVRLEFGIGTRRFRITRSPEFVRPKRRGSGETTSPASVVLEEHTGGRWTARSSRADEVGEIVTEVLGMGLAQFSKVVLLPQGEFAAFLRATADERRTLLEKLFDISTYAGVEKWLVERRRQLGVDLTLARTELGADLARLETVLAQVPPEVLGDDLQPDGATWSTIPAVDLPARVVVVAARLEHHAMSCLVAASEAEGRAAAAQTAATRAASIADGQRRGAAAAAQLQRLDDEALRWTELRRSVERAERAEAVSGDVRSLARVTQRHTAAVSRCRRANEALGRSAVADWSPSSVQGWVATLEEGATGLDEAAGVQRGLEVHRRRLTGLRTALTTATATLSTATERARVAGAAAEAAAVDVRAAGEAAALLGRLDSLVADADRRHALSQEVDRTRTALVSATDRVQAARGQEQEARAAHQALQQARLDGMAAELAVSLRDGQACLVCGSPEHPAPATTADPVSAQSVDDAAARWQRRVTVTQGEETQRSRLQQLLTTRTLDLEESCRSDEVPRDDPGDQDGPLAGSGLPTTEDLAHARTAARQRRAVAVAESRRLADAEPRWQAARRTVDELTSVTTTATRTLSATEAALLEVEAQVARGVTLLAQAVDEHLATCPCSVADDRPAPDLAGVAARHRQLLRVGRELAEAQTQVSDHAAELLVVRTSTENALRSNGFESVEAVADAAVPAAALAELRRRLRTADDRRAAAEATLSDPAVIAALGVDPVDPVQATAAADHARAALRQAQHAQSSIETSTRSLVPVRDSMALRVATLVPLVAEHAAVSELADTATGTGGQNTFRMRLTAFVLAARLEKVAALANERLQVMGDGRYQLAHTDDRAGGNRRSGLGLVVSDQWTGQVRDTASLSGGESFMASLALALGLADAVREESGGFDLNTLFIDEGFGTLDDESLEQVMAVLDGLRDGGRCVGVVSHVSDLRSRIPVQVRVDKTTAGSTVSTLGLEAPAA